jgi:PTS system fructose-specific IIC component
VAADTAVPEERFAGKPIVHASTGDAIKDSASLVARALAGADAAAASGGSAAAAATSGSAAGGGYLDQVAAAKAAQKSRQKGAYRHLLTGVSFMIPFVVAGGILIALSFAFGITAFEEEGTLAAALFEIGARSAFALMVPILSGYIAFSIADRPGLAPGMIGGVIAGTIGAGFLGGIISGFLAGYVALWLVRSIKLPKAAQGLMPVLIVPLISTAVVGLAMIYVVGEPVQFINARLTEFLQGLSGGSALILGVILGVMMAFDMGGPVNKAAYTFSVGLLGSGVNEPMAAVMAAGMTPPLGLALATTLWPRRFTEEEHEAGRAAWVLGASFITEGAIPFAAADPLRVLPSIIAGSAVAGAISMTAGVELNAPHGGVFVLAIPNVLTSLPIYLVAIAAGTIVTAVTVATLKRRVSIGEEAAVASAAA